MKFLIFSVFICFLFFSSNAKTTSSKATKCEKLTNIPEGFCVLYNLNQRTYIDYKDELDFRIANYLVNIARPIFLRCEFDVSEDKLIDVSIGPFETVRDCLNLLVSRQNLEANFCVNMVESKRSYNNINELNMRYQIYAPKKKYYLDYSTSDNFFDRTQQEILATPYYTPILKTQCNRIVNHLLLVFLHKKEEIKGELCTFLMHYKKPYGTIEKLLKKINNFILNLETHIFMADNFDLLPSEHPVEQIKFTDERVCMKKIRWASVRKLHVFCKNMVSHKRTYKDVDELRQRIKNFKSNYKYSKTGGDRFFDLTLEEISTRFSFHYKMDKHCNNDLNFLFQRFFNYKGTLNIPTFCENMIKFRRTYKNVEILNKKFNYYLNNLSTLHKKQRMFSSFKITVKGNKYFDYNYKQLNNINPGFNSFNHSHFETAYDCSPSLVVTKNSLLENLDNLQAKISMYSFRMNNTILNESLTNPLSKKLDEPSEINESELNVFNKLYQLKLKLDIKRIRLMLSLVKGHHVKSSPHSPDRKCQNQEVNGKAIPLSHKMLPLFLNFWLGGNVPGQVFDQGECGSCWAFSLAGMIESRKSLVKGKKVTLISRQHLLDCVPNGSCDGGNHLYALQYALNNSLYLDSEYPYKGKKNTCGFKPKSNHIVKASNLLNSFVIHKEVTAVELKYLLLQGPVSVSIDAKPFEFIFYRRGVLKYKCTKPSHSVLLFGWGFNVLLRKQYWIVRNSWGRDWGMKGNAHIMMEEDWDACGMYKNVVEFKSHSKK
jgi:hypothetical protein